MLSVIIDPHRAPERLMGLLATLTEGVVQGVIREVQIIDPGHGGDVGASIAALCEETGAKTAADFPTAVSRARSDVLLVLPSGLRLRPDWVEAIGHHLRAGGRQGVLRGEGRGLFRPGPFGVIVLRGTAEGLPQPDVVRLRSKLGRGVPRIG